jgi:hypothetical protein
MQYALISYDLQLILALMGAKAQGGEEKSENCMAPDKECCTTTRDLPGIRHIRSHASRTPPR